MPVHRPVASTIATAERTAVGLTTIDVTDGFGMSDVCHSKTSFHF